MNAIHLLQLPSGASVGGADVGRLVVVPELVLHLRARRQRAGREADLDERAHARRDDGVVDRVEARPVIDWRARRVLGVDADVVVEDPVEPHVLEPGLRVRLPERVLAVASVGGAQQRVARDRGRPHFRRSDSTAARRCRRRRRSSPRRRRRGPPGAHRRRRPAPREGSRPGDPNTCSLAVRPRLRCRQYRCRTRDPSRTRRARWSPTQV